MLIVETSFSLVLNHRLYISICPESYADFVNDIYVRPLILLSNYYSFIYLVPGLMAYAAVLLVSVFVRLTIKCSPTTTFSIYGRLILSFIVLTRPEPTIYSTRHLVDLPFIPRKMDWAVRMKIRKTAKNLNVMRILIIKIKNIYVPKD
jgi:hypothetical protein